MSKFITAISSSIGKKLLTGITGLSLSMFVLIHLLGNLQLFFGPDPINLYTHRLESIGPILYLIELALLAVFVIHAIIGVNIYLNKKKARPIDYSVYNSAGEPSKQNLSSRSMIVTGSIILIFLVIHVITLKFGPNINEGYVTIINGTEMRDLHRLVIEQFQNPLYVIGYVFVMILLGLHLRHGFWSAFQSLGVLNKKYRPAFYTLGLIFSIIIAVGFLVLPIWIYFAGAVQ